MTSREVLGLLELLGLCAVIVVVWSLLWQGLEWIVRRMLKL